MTSCTSIFRAQTFYILGTQAVDGGGFVVILAATME